ncbi:hypothetical protein ACRE_013900 [Hapsidospora chrysogenum ATCC 11550]|uniref:Uncharacterized protein n=1 Tax=Hapsidospora chrysogenum (strain ATCC 11550 / CBS 779.69 / DSM 880 / IAM 14645 / JCM 23072 / IMI 49137) TaxID=857340 RepID=A0A086TEK7_HAPC1|nr:hypothetical protein ACRE_013900 [Hapsidospora chrysogenum ATCC 11550]
MPAMSTSQVAQPPSIDDQLPMAGSSTSNPAAAAAATAQGSRRATFFTTYGDAAKALRPRLHPSVAAFLAAARAPDAPLFYFADGMPCPHGDFGGLFDNWTADFMDEPEDSIVRLYISNLDACGADTELAFPVDEYPQNWHPLETILSNWIALIRLGKVVASPNDEEPALYGSLKVGNWEWRPYSDAQVAGCVAAWDRLCDAIEVRRRQNRHGSTTVDDDADNIGNRHEESLLTPMAMDAAKIPDPSFARSFLGLARRPRHIRQIAPGLSLPPADAAAFAAAQPFTHLPRRVPQWDGTEGEDIVPPVYVFFSEPGAPQIGVSDSRRPFPFRLAWCGGHQTPPDGIAFPSRVPPGVYTECLVRNEPEPTEEAFRMLLPFNLYGARLSSGAEMKNRSPDELFQHGFKPFGGNPHRPQRLERLLEHWEDLVERGVWSVGPHGVQGSIEVFRDATANGADYTIPSSWWS